MEIFLRWAAAQFIGLALTGALFFRDVARGYAIAPNNVTELLAAYCDRFAGIGITLCVFALNDLVFRATDGRTNPQCVGPAIRFPAFCLLYLLIIYVLVYGIALMAAPFTIARLFAGYAYFFYGLMLLLVATLVLSLTYVIRLEITVLRH